MKIIGITGGIGTGKSTVLNLLRERYDAYVMETDKLAHALMLPGQSAYGKIVQEFGTEILNEDSTINRGKLGTLVFQKKEELNKLNRIVHPAVKQFILQDIHEKKQDSVPYYIIEAALLIEDGYRTICDELWYIYVEKEERIKRLLLGRGGSREKWEQVMDSQSSEDFYRKYCDVIIDNGNKIEDTAKIINEILFSIE